MNLQATLEALRRGADARLLRLVALELGGALPSLGKPEMLRLQAGLTETAIRSRSALDETARATLIAVLTGAMHALEQQSRRAVEQRTDLLAVSQGARKPWRDLLGVADADQVLRPGKLAAAAGLDPSVASKEMEKLCQAGFVEELEMDPSVVDRRGRFYRLTPRGERLAEGLKPPRSVDVVKVRPSIPGRATHVVPLRLGGDEKVYAGNSGRRRSRQVRPRVKHRETYLLRRA